MKYLVLMMIVWAIPVPLATAEPGRPNVLLILADDLGYGDLGCYGQTRIRTPNLDRLARDGMRFTQAYAGSTVCAPSRCCLMTGKHTGHANIRGNKTIAVTDHTIADWLKPAGYRTALIGKWGLGEANSVGVPNKRGFDTFFGYLNQQHAHNYYPDFLWRNEVKTPIAGNVVQGGVASQRGVYAPDLFTQEALAFLDRSDRQPFFLFLAYTSPHANNEKGAKDGNGMEVPTDAPYTAEKWPQPQKNHAAMITRLDADVGKVLAKLHERGLDEQTLVIFTSDNGTHKEGGALPAFFQSSGPLRGIKRDLTDGGIRVPMIIRWSGKIAPGVNSHVCAFWDMLPTIADIAGVPTPKELDGVSFAPTLLGKPGQRSHEFLYWEFHERGSQFAIRMGDWKAIRPAIGAPIQLYDVVKDIHEDTDVAAANPQVIAQVEAILRTARTPDANWPLVNPPIPRKSIPNQPKSRKSAPSQPKSRD